MATWRNGRNRETQRPATTPTSATMTERHTHGSEHASRFHAEIISKARARCQRWLKPLRANVPFLLFLFAGKAANSWTFVAGRELAALRGCRSARVGALSRGYWRARGFWERRVA